MPATGGPVVKATSAPSREESPAWSPDGSRLAFVSDRTAGYADIFVMRSTVPYGTAVNVTQLSDGLNQPCVPGYDGYQIPGLVWTGADAIALSLWCEDYEDYTIKFAVVSVRKKAFVKNYPRANGNTPIDVARNQRRVLLQGGAVLNLGTGAVQRPPRGVSAAAWSPDETWVAFDTYTNGVSRTFVAPAAGGAKRLVATGKSVMDWAAR